MSWYLQSGKESDVVMSTRIRFARNLEGFKFNLKSKQEVEELKNKIKDNLYAIGYGLKYIELKDLDSTNKMTLCEKNLISKRYLIQNKDDGAILINEDENICILINDEDHLKIQVFSAGYELENTLNFAIELDQKIEEVLGYATNKKYGYLTALPTNCGTGLKASVRVHLPALKKTQNIDKIFYALNNFGISIKETHLKSGNETEDIYQISSKRTLGVSEKEIVESIKIFADKLIEEERKTRKFLMKDSIDLEDLIYRSYGILANCRKIGYEESQKLISNIKIGVDLGVFKELSDDKIQKLYLYTKPSNLQKFLGEKLNPIERHERRAEVIKQIINEK